MRLRIRFSKTGKIRWTSHRDVARMWERAFRRIELPLAYSEGFSPRPKVSFGLALSTGHESVAEYLDVELVPDSGLEPASLPGRLTAVLPDGLDVQHAAVIDDRADSLQHEVTSCRYELTVFHHGISEDEARALTAAALAADAIVITRTRKGQTTSDDVRPALLSVEVLGSTEADDGRPCVVLAAELATQPRGLRPAELLTALSPDRALEEVRVRRTHQWISRADGAREEPLALPEAALADAPPALPLLERVS